MALASTAVIKGADISKCGRFRYRLWRWWDDQKPMACWIMLNPSTADASEDDPTIRKCIGFTKRWDEAGLYELGGIMVVNLFAFRATQPADLRRHHAFSVIGELRDPDDRAQDAPGSPFFDVANVNDVFLQTEAQACPLVVAAWGNHGWIDGRGALVRSDLRRRKITVHHLGLTKQDRPRHPGRIAYATPLQRWDV